MTTEAQAGAGGAQGTPAATDTTNLVPDSPEYRAAMIAKAEGQSGTPAPVTPQAEPKTPEVDPNAPTPKLTDPPKGDEGKEAPTGGEGVAGYDFQKAFSDGSLFNDLNAEKPSDALVTGLTEKLGLTPEQAAQVLDRFRAGDTAINAASEAKLFEAAGGKAQFNALITWGQQNLPQDQKVFYENMLNGPDAAHAIQILQQKMTASRDPSLVNANARQAPATVGFRDQSEMITAMRDPRYKESPAYRAEVEQKMRFSKF